MKPNENLFAGFMRHAPEDKGAPLLITIDGRVFSYADALDESGRMARCLSDLGLRAGDRVTVQVHKSAEAVWLFLACLRGGFVFHPLNIDYQREELEFFVANARPTAIICDPSQHTLFAELTAAAGTPVLTLNSAGRGTLTDACLDMPPAFRVRDRKASDLAVLLYSSGTTGVPKGAKLSHGNLTANLQTLVQAWGFSAADRLLHALPIYHAHGLLVGLGCVLMSGSSMHFLPRFSTADVILRLPDSTVMMGVPTYYTRLLADPAFTREACSRMRLFISGSAPLPVETFRAFEARTGHAILERYGMTETCMNTANPLVGERRPGSVGPPLPGVSVRVVDADGQAVPPGETGELEVAGPNVFSGYWRRQRQASVDFTADGYFRTGDLARIDADGYVWIAGRSRDLIISGGLNVYPREVELLLDELPGVAESAVIGAPHPDLGEGVIAIVEATAGTAPDAAALLESLRPRLAGYKRPKQLHVVAALPRNSLGKVMKNRLREAYAGAFGDTAVEPSA